MFRLAHMYNRADLEFHANETGLEHWSCTQPCSKCPCNKSDNSWANFFGDWRTTMNMLLKIIATTSNNNNSNNDSNNNSNYHFKDTIV